MNCGHLARHGFEFDVAVKLINPCMIVIAAAVVVVVAAAAVVVIIIIKMTMTTSTPAAPLNSSTIKPNALASTRAPSPRTHQAIASRQYSQASALSFQLGQCLTRHRTARCSWGLWFMVYGLWFRV